ncbi:hypothetical protein L195_g045393 [Trifolium pratense]|uniref:Uncharacterized protein n=1 Tax=Trifolium pratense TaxID=57577 RepID=A0A2K3MER9_TRIPR|nr:hypothetical protein L195_g045393 [Trifolium pratense]
MCVRVGPTESGGDGEIENGIWEWRLGLESENWEIWEEEEEDGLRCSVNGGKTNTICIGGDGVFRKVM